MKKLIQERIEIAKAVAVAVERCSRGPGSLGSDRSALYAWSVADGICKRAEDMAEEEAEAARVAEDEANRKLRAEEDADNACHRHVAGGFEGPCLLVPHGGDQPCLNADGDRW